MRATINGAARELPDGLTLAELVRELGLAHGAGIAIAVNARVVRGAAHDGHRLAEGDAVEIIRAVAGG